jgi:hypothetical protein
MTVSSLCKWQLNRSRLTLIVQYSRLCRAMTGFVSANRGVQTRSKHYPVEMQQPTFSQGTPHVTAAMPVMIANIWPKQSVQIWWFRTMSVSLVNWFSVTLTVKPNMKLSAMPHLLTFHFWTLLTNNCCIGFDPKPGDLWAWYDTYLVKDLLSHIVHYIELCSRHYNW